MLPRLAAPRRLLERTDLSHAPDMNASAAPRAAHVAAALTLVALALRSPSVHPEWSWLPDTLLIVTALVATARAGRAPGLAGAPAAVAAGLLLLGHLRAADAHASWGDLAAVSRLALAFTAGAALRAAPSSGELRRAPVAATWAAAGAMAAAHAAWQVLVAHPRLMDAGVTPAMAAQLGDGRGNSVFLLPAHLSAFLAAAGLLALGLTWSLASCRAARPRVALAGAAFACCLAGQLVAVSFGGVALLAAGLVACAGLALPSRGRRAVVAAALLAAALLVGAGVVRRRATLARERPVSARLSNWLVAAELVRQAPVHGWGGGSFEVEHARLKPPEGNDARHAHQELLEAASEHGAAVLPLIAAGIAVLLAPAVLAIGRGARWDPLRAAECGAVVVVLGHALLDFGWSDPTWGVPAAALLGAWWAGSRAPGWNTACAHRSGPRGAAPAIDLRSGLAAAALAAVVVSHSAITSAAAWHGLAARDAAARADAAAAHESLLAASATDPLDGRFRTDAAAACLAGACDAGAAVDLAAQGVALSPRRASAHAMLAGALVADGRLLEALTAATRATQLAPRRDDFIVLRDDIARRLSAP